MLGVNRSLLVNLEVFEGRLRFVLKRDPSDKSLISAEKKKERANLIPVSRPTVYVWPMHA